MPGTPATSPRAGAPRYTNTDGVNFSGQVNGVTDALDAAMALDSQGTLASRHPAGTAHRGRYYFVTGDATASNNGRLWRCDGPNWTEVGMEIRHGLGMALAYRSAAINVADGGTIPLTAKEVDPEGWHNSGSGYYIPQVAGYYTFSWLVTTIQPGLADRWCQSFLLKNGTPIRDGTVSPYASNGSCIAVANGSTDNFGLALGHNWGGVLDIVTGTGKTFMHAHLLRRF